MSKERQYDIVVFGATGFTGKWCAEHITTNLSTDLKWAIAGRSTSKLQAVAAELKELNADRAPPAIEECSLQLPALEALAKKTTILVSTVGPYALHGTPVVEACVKSGTHYLDVTGETPWVLSVVRRFHEQAVKNKVIVIPQAGIDSVPADILSWSLVTHVQHALSKPVSNLFFTVHKIKGQPSGGTLASALGILDVYSLQEMREAMQPWALSPIPPSSDYDRSSAPTLFEQASGVKVVSDLGVLTTGPQGRLDRSQVYRSWGLIEAGKFYGKRFRFYPYVTARNIFLGFLIHVAINVGLIFMLLSPMRALARHFVTAPGSGPSKESSRNDFIHYKAVAEVDSPSPGEPKRAIGSFQSEGSPYKLTGIFLAEAAYSLLKDDSLAKRIGGGVLTPATLGQKYVDRLQKAGIKIETRMLPN